MGAARFRTRKLVIEPEPRIAVERACRASSKDDLVLIIEALFLVGAIKKALPAGQLHLENHPL
jgi:hypothetical protein